MTQWKWLDAPIHEGQTHKGVCLGGQTLLEHLRDTHSPLLSKFNEFKFYDDANKTSEAMVNKFHFLHDECQTEKNLMIIGGDHSLSIASLSSILKNDPKRGILWFDAHGDVNHPDSSPTGHLHGMPLAYLMNRTPLEERFDFLKSNHFIQPQQIVYFGLRDLDPDEVAFLDESSVKFFSADDYNNKSVDQLFSESFLYLKDNSFGESIHISFDVDSLDPKDFPCTGTPVNQGLNLPKTLSLLERLSQTEKVKSAEFVEFNPELCQTPEDLAQSNTTLGSCLKALIGA